MNRQDSLRPVTRRALRINYESPGICAFPIAPSSGGSGGDSEAIIDFVSTFRLPGPVLRASSYTSTTTRLEWSAVTDAAFYQIYRSASPTGPFTFLQGPVGPRFYVDTPPSPGFWYYQVTAIEPNAGETERSNIGLAEVLFPPPPVAGYSVWAAPESGKFSDLAGTIPATSGGEILFWEDKSGLSNHLKRNAGFAPSDGGARNGPDVFYNRPAVVFGDNGTSALVTDNLVTISGGVTVFLVAAFRNPSVGVAESGGVCFNLRNGGICMSQDASGDKRWVTERRNIVSTDLTDPTLAGTDFRLMGLRLNNTSQVLELYRNGSIVATTSDTTPALTGRVGLGFYSSTDFIKHFSGAVEELLVYPGPLSDDDVAAVNAWLNLKHNL